MPYCFMKTWAESGLPDLGEQGKRLQAILDAVKEKTRKGLEDHINLLEKQLKATDRASLRFEDAARICMQTRRVAVDQLGLYLINTQSALAWKDRTLPCLGNAVNLVAEYYQNKPSEEAKNKATLTRYYVVNETARLNRMRKLYDSLDAFIEVLEEQRKGIPRQARNEDVHLLKLTGPLLVEYSNANRETGGDNSKVTDQKISRESIGTTEVYPLVVDELLSTWAQMFFAEVSQFLFEIELEASPYGESALQQAEASESIFERLDSIFQVLRSFVPKGNNGKEVEAILSKRLDSFEGLLEKFRIEILEELQAPGENDRMAERVFKRLQTQTIPQFRDLLDRLLDEGQMPSLHPQLLRATKASLRASDNLENVAGSFMKGRGVQSKLCELFPEHWEDAKYFRQNKDMLLKEYKGKFVGIRNKEVIAAADDLLSLHAELKKQLGNEASVFTEYVGEKTIEEKIDIDRVWIDKD